MRIKPLYIIFVFLFSFFVFSPVHALMPPHVNGAENIIEGVLTGNSLIIKGYSLAYADLKELKVIEVNSKKAVDFKTELNCEWVGKGDQPGSRQQKCLIKVGFTGLKEGIVYEYNFLDTKESFKWQPK